MRRRSLTHIKRQSVRIGTLVLALLASACGGDEPIGPSNTTVSHPDAPPLPGESECTVTEVVDIAVESASHVAVCTTVEYATNPPSGGDHWPVWAAYRKYDGAIPRELYVHDLEHGGVALLFRCEGACPEVVSALDAVFDSMTDSACTGPKSRMLRAPDPELAAPIAVAAWGATYTATCIDEPSLSAFVKAHYARGPEDTCADGVDATSAVSCD